MDFSQSQYPVLTNTINHRTSLPNSKYLSSQYLPPPTTISNVRPSGTINPTINNSTIETPTEEDKSELSKPEVLQTSQFRSRIKSNRQEKYQNTDLDNDDNDDNDADEDFDLKFLSITPKRVFVLTRNFVSKHPLAFLTVVAVASLIIYVIYYQYENGGTLSELFERHISGASREEDAEEVEEENNEENDNEGSSEYENEEEESNYLQDSILNYNNNSMMPNANMPFMFSNFAIPPNMSMPSFQPMQFPMPNASM